MTLIILHRIKIF